MCELVLTTVHVNRSSVSAKAFMNAEWWGVDPIQRSEKIKIAATSASAAALARSAKMCLLARNFMIGFKYCKLP
jgi:hypothetical protein